MSTDEITSSGATLGLGYAYTINRHIALDAKLRVGNMTIETDAVTVEMDSRIAQLLIGLQILF